MKLDEAKQILKKAGYLMEAGRNTKFKRNIVDFNELENDSDVETEYSGPITVENIDQNNYEDYIGKYVNVKDHVNLSHLRLKKLPIKFGTVGGNFMCFDNSLTTLVGAPRKVGGLFDCGDNKLTTLEGAPNEVGGAFGCNFNHLSTLEGAPVKVGKSFWCTHNELTTLEGAPKYVGGGFDCNHNELTTLDGVPNKLGDFFDCSYNNLTTLDGAPSEVDGDFYCGNNKTKFTKDDVLAVCDVNRDVMN